MSTDQDFYASSSDTSEGKVFTGGVDVQVFAGLTHEQGAALFGDLVKIVHKLAEDGKIAVRHARTHARDALKKLSGVSEDDVKHAEKDLQKAHDDFIAKIDQLIKAKEAEIMEV